MFSSMPLFKVFLAHHIILLANALGHWYINPSLLPVLLLSYILMSKTYNSQNRRGYDACCLETLEELLQKQSMFFTGENGQCTLCVYQKKLNCVQLCSGKESKKMAQHFDIPKTYSNEFTCF
jgi:hypothetical protein